MSSISLNSRRLILKIFFYYMEEKGPKGVNSNVVKNVCFLMIINEYFLSVTYVIHANV